MPRLASPSTTTPSGLIPLGGRPRLRDYLAGVWARREFVYSLAAGELRSQHMNTVLGNVWHVLNPLLLIGVYYLIFGIIFKGVRDDLAGPEVHFVAFLSVGVFTYGFMQRCFTRGAGAITSNLGLIRSLQFPRAVLPLATVTKEVLSFAPSVVVMLIVVAATGTPPRWSWLGFVPVFVLMALFGLGGSLITARLTESVRDVKNLLPFVFRLGFYLSGVLFDVSRIVEIRPDLRALGDVFLINPFYVFISLSREYVLRLPSASRIEHLWLSAGLWTVALALLGLWFFTAAEKRYGRG